MKSSPKASGPGPKTPVSGKKLVQARLPFKTLSGSEPPLADSNDISDDVLATAKTQTPIPNSRKRKQKSIGSKEDGVHEPKNKRLDFEDEIALQTSEVLDDSNASVVVDAEKNPLERNSESKENVAEKSGDNDAVQEANQDETSEDAPAGLIKIKMPFKKSKKAKKGKKHDAAASSKDEERQNQSETVEETDGAKADEIVAMEVDEKVETTAEQSSAPENDESDELNKTLNDSVMSDMSEQCSTPANHKLTPKQLNRLAESAKKKKEKEVARLEQERKRNEEKEQRQREKEEKELQKKQEREEKEEQRKKEKEMREQKILEEKLEKQKEKEQKEQQRKKEREEKEELKKREKEEREQQKKKERDEKEREKEEERKKREDEKRQKMEAEQSKNRKTSEMFVKFFVPKKVDNKSESNENDEDMDVEQTPKTFMSFQVKDDMKVAPIVRRALKKDERLNLERYISSDQSTSDLYLSQLKKNSFVPRKMARTWLDDDDEKCSNDDLFIVGEDGQGVQVVTEEPTKLYRAKFFKFSENRRPPYYGTWRKKSSKIRPRNPLSMDSQLDYEIDSDDEWEEEEPGESLHGSDDEKEIESEDEYEIDNEFFVPHGHLSDEELNEDEADELNDTVNMQFKLKLAQNELDDERKKKTQKLKPRLIGMIWQNADGSKPDNCSNGVWDLLNKHAMYFTGTCVKVERPTNTQGDNSDDENSNPSKPLGPRRLQIGEKDVPDLIRLINGNQHNSKFLAQEFGAYLSKNNQLQREYSGASIKAKIKEVAVWQACPEEGRMFKKLCWYVPKETRQRYNLNDLTLPNTWSYTLPPRRPVETAEGESEIKAAAAPEKKLDLQEIISLSDDSNSFQLSETLTPELIKQASSKNSVYNIAKFIRPLTSDEKKKQFEPITLARRPSEDQMDEMPSTSQETQKPPTKRARKRESNQTSESSAPNKRVSLLASGPLGQNLTPGTKGANNKPQTTLVSLFKSSNQKKRKSIDEELGGTSSNSTAGSSDGAKKIKLNEPVIVID